MANLNLSEFTEKLFVADADHTFIWDTAASISKRVSRNSWLNSGTLTSDAPVTISQTWNNAAVAFTGFKVVATDTASGGTSSLFDARTTAGGSQFSVQKGVAVGGNYSSSTTYGVKTPFVSFGSYYGSGALCGSVNGLTLFATPTVNAYISIGAAIATIGNTNSALAIGAEADTILLRDGAANTLALRNGGAAQTFNVYGTSSSNNTVYERMFMRYSQSALAFQVGTEQLGATGRPLEFFTNGTRKFAIAGSGINTSTFYGHDNTNSSILILRTLSGTAKGQFYVNPSGNCEFGLGFPSAGFPILLSESGNSYFNGGNVGIGTTAPTSRLHVQATGQTGVRENLLKCTVSDSGNDAFYMANATVADGSFVPGFIGAVFSSSARYCLNLAGQTTAANDTGTAPMVAFSAAITTDATDPNNGTLSAVGTRPLFTWVNFTTTHMQMAANGNLGIGTTSPTSKLHVVGDAVLTGDLLGTNYTIGVPTILTQSNISITNNHSGVADSAIVITPKGTGGVIFGPKPDGTATGGNARGNYAVDLQAKRGINTQVASGINSFIAGGIDNTASGNYSFVAGNGNIASGNFSSINGGIGNTASSLNSLVCGGESNIASGGRSNISGGLSNSTTALFGFIAGGQNGLADRYSLNAHAAGQFSTRGDAQKTTAVSRNKTTTNSPVELFLDGSSTRYTVSSGKIISMLINITGTKSDGSAVAHYVRQYSIKNIGGTTSEVYAAVTVGTDNAAGTSIALSADNTNDSLKIEVTGVASETWRWVASVDAVEVGHGV